MRPGAVSLHLRELTARRAAGRAPRHTPVPPYESDPLTIDSPPGTRWTTANTAEQMGGVLTPLTITLTTEPAELGFLGCFAYLGILPRAAVRMPVLRSDYHLGYFYGQCSANVRVIRRHLDLTPGTSGAAYEQQMFGGEGLGESERLTRRRVGIVSVKMPIGLLTMPGELRALRAEFQQWWSQTVPAMPTATLEEAKATCLEAERQHGRVTPYVWMAAIIAQLAYGQLSAVVATSGNAGLETTVSGGMHRGVGDGHRLLVGLTRRHHETGVPRPARMDGVRRHGARRAVVARAA